MGEKSKKGQKSPKNALKMEKGFLARRGYPKSFLRLGATLPKFLRKKFLRKKACIWTAPNGRWSNIENIGNLTSYLDSPS